MWLYFLFLGRVSWDQRRSETPQFVTTRMDIRGLHSAEGHCYHQYSQPYSTSFEITNWIEYLITTIFFSHTISTNGSPPKTTNLAPTGGLFRSQQCPDDNVGASDYNAGNTRSRDTQFGQPANQFHPPPPPPPPPPPGYSYPPSQQPFPDVPQFNHQSPFNMTPSSQPSSGATQGSQSYESPWQGFNFPQGGYGGPQMFPPQEFTGHGPSSASAPWVPPAPPEHDPVVRPTSSASTAPGQHSGSPRRLLISLATKRFLPAAEPRRTDVARIANLPQLPEIY